MAFAAGNPITNMLNGLIGFINSDVMRAVGIIAVISPVSSITLVALVGNMAGTHPGWFLRSVRRVLWISSADTLTNVY